MKRKLFAVLLCVAMIFGLCACDMESESQADVDAATGQEMLNSASALTMHCNGHSVNKRCDLVVDNQVVGQLQESGFFDAHWNISAGGEDWFSAKFVTDEWINNVEGVISATTYGVYDTSDNCIGYCQQRVVNGDYWYVFLNADGTDRGLYMDENGNFVYSADGSMIATANYTVESYSRGTYDTLIMPANGNELSAMDKLMIFIRLERMADESVEED
ncbi:MAG: hypothetical protein KBT19_01525 [Lachnospiraceae bacterium]|nr:hypothetical protein [Candidatus Colinaster equi]